MRRTRWPLAVAAALSARRGRPARRAQDKQPTATGTGGAAASVDPLATSAAIDVLARGGNAFDAAVAAASVLGVVEPYSCGLGGGGFMVIRDGDSGQITTIDSRETAPAAMKPDSFFINGKPPTDAQFPINRYSGLSVGVPGTPAPWDYVAAAATARTRSARRSPTASASRATASTVDQTFFDQTDAATAVLRRRPVDARRSTSTPTARRATSARRSGTPTWRTRTAARPPRATKRLLHRPGRRRDRQAAAQVPPLAPTADHDVAARPADARADLAAYQVIAARARPAQLPRRRRLRHGPAVLRRHDRRSRR